MFESKINVQGILKKSTGLQQGSTLAFGSLFFVSTSVSTQVCPPPSTTAADKSRYTNQIFWYDFAGPNVPIGGSSARTVTLPDGCTITATVAVAGTSPSALEAIAARNRPIGRIMDVSGRNFGSIDPTLLSDATSYSIAVPVTSGAGATVGGWIEFNRNNVFDAADFASAFGASGSAGLTCPTANVVTITGNGAPDGSFTVVDLTGAGISLGTLANGEAATLTFECEVN